MSDDLHIPIVQEEARIFKRSVDTEHVSVRMTTDEESVLLQDELRREHVELTRIPVGCEVAEAPAIRTEGDVTIIPVVEERLHVEKRLFLVEELHLRRTTIAEPVEMPTTVRRTRVDVERTHPDQQEDH